MPTSCSTDAPVLASGDPENASFLSASALGKYKTELYDPVVGKFQPSPQWINLFVLVKDPENRVRRDFTPCITILAPQHQSPYA